jgi:hypothetical protein
MEEHKDDDLDDGYASCILEFRDRIAALEAAQRESPMTDHERAAINMASCPSIDRIPDFTGAAPAMDELRARIEALESAQLEQAESNRFCTDAIVRRVEALEATQQDKLDRLIARRRPEALDKLDQLLAAARAASAEAQPAGLVERVRQIIGLDPVGDGKARAAIREVAAFLEATQGDWCASAAEVVAELVAELRQEADR